MSPDRNKTELTQNISAKVAAWLDDNGFKPVETEVPVARGWVADLAGVCVPTQTEMINLKLVPRRPRRDGDSDPLLPEFSAVPSKDPFAAWYDEMKTIPSPLTVVVEVKTSMGDFRGDRKWAEASWPSNLCYVAMPEGMVPPARWPAGWGVILCAADGSSIRKVYPSTLQRVSAEARLDVVVAIATRRDNATRFDRQRQIQKEVRLGDVDVKTIARLKSAFSVVRDISRGTPVEQALIYNGISAEARAKIPKDLREHLNSLVPAASRP